jgi:hypothetical protein
MTRSETVGKIQEMFGSVPGWLSAMPDDQLEMEWANMSWLMNDSKLSARDKALVAWGAASAVHCPY